MSVANIVGLSTIWRVICTLTQSLQDIRNDKLCKILLDKDKWLPYIPEATDETHWVKKPTE